MREKSVKLVVSTIAYFIIIIIAGLAYVYFSESVDEANNEKKDMKLVVSYPDCQKFDEDECGKENFIINPGEVKNVQIKIDNENDKPRAYEIKLKNLNIDTETVFYSIKDESDNAFISDNSLPYGETNEYTVLNANIDSNSSVIYDIEFKANETSNVQVDVEIQEK